MTRQYLIGYCLTLPGAYEDYPFDEVADDNATTVMRHQGNKKSFAMIMKHDGDLYLNLKCEPLEADFLRQIYQGVIPGYHMNKTHWNTIVIGLDVPNEEIERQIRMSYDLIRPKYGKVNSSGCVHPNRHITSLEVTALPNTLPLTKQKILITGVSDYDFQMQYSDAETGLHPPHNDNIHYLRPSDLSTDGEPERVIDKAAQKLGGLTGLVLNHAYSTHSPIGEWTAEHIGKHLTVNVRASMLMIQRFAQHSQNGGCITLFTSGQYLGPMVSEIAYAVSTEAIRCLCVQASAALAPQGIRVNCVNPGPNDTGYMSGDECEAVKARFPLGRWGMPDDAAKLVQFLHSDQASWITGQTIASEGGFQRYY